MDDGVKQELKALAKRVKELEEDLDEMRQLLPRLWQLHTRIVESKSLD